MTTTKNNFNYNNEALFRLAKIYLAKYGYDLNQFYATGTSSGTFTMQGYVEDNAKLLVQPGEKEADGNSVLFRVGKYLRIYLSVRGY
jgi:hypothetical protein